MAAPGAEITSRHTKLKVRQCIAIRINYILVFTVVSPAPLNLDVDSTRLAGRPFRRRCWPPDQRPTMRIDRRGRELSKESSFANDAKE